MYYAERAARQGITWYIKLGAQPDKIVSDIVLKLPTQLPHL